MSKEIRGIATISVYVYGNSEQDLLIESREIVNYVNNKYDCIAEIEKLYTAPFGKLKKEITQININN